MGGLMLAHASYSTDMNQPDFDLFPKLKEPMCGWRFSSLEELSTDGTWAIRNMNKSSVFDVIVMLPKRWDSVIEKEGDHTEWLWIDNLKELKVLVKKYRVRCF